MLSADDVIKKLKLRPLRVEGGFYVETYRSSEKILRTALPDRYKSARSFCTAIYYLLTPETCSPLHRLRSDEIFHFYLGDSVIMLQLFKKGRSKVVTIGCDIEGGEQPQVVVPRGVWQGSMLTEGGRFALLGTTVAPGFDFSDYESGDREELIKRYPEQRSLIEKLTS
jgi:predicted cupin superfamily sugar epimerase